MTTEGFIRKARIAQPRMPGGEINLQPPPEVTRSVPGGLMQKLMPVVMVVAMIGMTVMMVSTGRRQLSPQMFIFPIMMLMSMAGMSAHGGGRASKSAELNEERKDYLRYLVQTRDEVHDTAIAQRKSTTWSQPDPSRLITLTGTRRMWERRTNDADFCHVRLGLGSQRLASRLMAPQTAPLEDLEPVTSVALRRFVRTHSVVHDMPTAVSLRGFPSIGFDGDRNEVRSLIRSLIMQICTFHGPDHVLVAIITSDVEGEAWSWAKWLPHCQHPTARDGLGSVRMIFDSLHDFETSMPDLSERGRFARSAPVMAGRPQLLLILDDGYVSGDEKCVSDAGLDSVTVIDICPNSNSLSRRGLQLAVEDGAVGAQAAGGLEEFAKSDNASIAEAEVFARRMSRYRTATAAQMLSLEQETTTVADPGLMPLLGIHDAGSIDPNVTWRPRSSRERLRVPIGLSADGSPLEIDIKEAAEFGMGPHGLCIGATGSGKSEFLRTLVLSMIITHSADSLNLVLVDFKGGATFLGLDGAPQVAAVITNLEEEGDLVDRMGDAIKGEMNRRQELLRSSGNFVNVAFYEAARMNGATNTQTGLPLDPFPALFIVVDEFSELLSQRPDFADLFVMVGRLGRSLRVHLLLASQRLEEGKLKGLDSHLSYRIGLKTFSAAESRTVLGVPDAYHLPAIPGSGFLKCDSDEPRRFNASYVSGPYVPKRGGPKTAEVAKSVYGDVRPKMFTAAEIPVELPPEPEVLELEEPEDDLVDESHLMKDGKRITLLEMCVSRLQGHGSLAHEVWLPPLSESPTVDMLLPSDFDWRDDSQRYGNLVIPIGTVDRPYDQRRDNLYIDVSGAAGNVAIVGGPQSGKSNALSTLIMAASVLHTPEQVQFYCLDFGGGKLAGLANLPHVGSVATRLEPDRVRRTIAEMLTLIRQREERFRALGIDSMREFRRRKTAALAAPPGTPDPLADDKFGDVFIIIDGWAAARDEDESLQPKIQSLATQGLSYGVHLVLATNRWADIRAAIKDAIGTRVELRLGDPMESEMGKQVAKVVPKSKPGRGINVEQLHMLIGLPRMDSQTTDDNISDAVRASVEEIKAVSKPGSFAPEVRMLPEQVHRNSLLGLLAAEDRTPTKALIGINENELAPVFIDFNNQQHFMAFADPECGKTTLLRNIVASIMENNTPDQAKILLLDYRRTMLGVVPDEYLITYCSSIDQTKAIMAALAGKLKERLPGVGVTQQQLRERSWWSGAEYYVIVDDYDLVATNPNPLLPLVDYLGQGKDVGLHFITTRRSGGVGRAIYDPVLGRLKDLTTDALLMSGNKDEGAVIGGIKMSAMPPGRGTYITRAGGNQLIQIAYMPPI
ncbi:MAG: type VII secretion protein EccCa [Segniliparus sp.]|uniref:type VII secretion protein EccCa n=1 Tax=Segniliparus sp. TaxID=2804064 RepID=UPI003F348102